MTVTTSAKWDMLRDGTFKNVLGEMCATVLKIWLTKYVPKHFAQPYWDTVLRSAAYARKKAGIVSERDKGKSKALRRSMPKGQPIADLYVTGKLREAVIVDAPQNIKVEGSAASVTISGSDVPYAAAHNYGYLEGGIIKREYLDIERDRDALIRELREEIKAFFSRPAA